MNVLKLRSSGVIACGLVVRRGFHGELSLLSGFTINASWGLTRFCVRNAFPKLGFLDFEASCRNVSLCDSKPRFEPIQPAQ